MAELQDLSGPFNPNLKFSDFSKEFLNKLVYEWQWAFLQLDAAWFNQVKTRFGDQCAHECSLEMWLRVETIANPRYAKIADIPCKSVVDSLKIMQLPLENTIGGLFPVEYDIRNENHTFVTVKKCTSLDWCEKNAPERIKPMCQVNHPKIMKQSVANPAIQVTPVKLPPRQGNKKFACKWEFKLDVPAETPVRSKKEVVDETKKVPELSDLSGPFYPNLTRDRLSKELLLKLMTSYQYSWLMANGGYYDGLRNRGVEFEVRNEMELATWKSMAKRVNWRYPKIGNFPLNTVVDSLKAMQLPLDNTIGLFPASYEIVNPNLVYERVEQCRTLEYLRKAEPERIIPMCHELEKPMIEAYMLNPKIKVTPLKLPPYDDPNERPCCIWELKIEE
jgi:hypothetical protein